MQFLASLKTGANLLITILIFAVIVNNVNAKDTTYVDFGYAGTEIGTKEKPLRDLPPNGTLKEHSVFLMKRGTYKFSTRSYVYTANNVTFGAYGLGDRPIIEFDSAKYGRMFDVRGYNMVVENLYLRVQTVDIQSSELKSSTVLSVGPNDSVCYVRNVLIRGGFRGISGGNKLEAGMPTYMVKGHLVFENVEVDSVGHDGFYLTFANKLTMKNCTTTHCNLAYKPEWPNTIGGDALQCGEILYINIESCKFDRSDTPGKYAMITTGYLEVRVNNTDFISRTDGIGAACIYPGGNSIRDKNGGNTIESAIIDGKLVRFKPVWYVDNCRFYGGRFNAQIRCHGIYFNNCVFSSASETSLDSGNEIFVNNSVFYNAPTGISNYTYAWKNINNNIFYDITENMFKGNGIRMVSNNLFYNSKNPSQTQTINGTVTIHADPLFEDAKNGNFRLKAASPAIDKGNNAFGTKADMYGTPRPYNGTVDIGPIEYAQGDLTTPQCFGSYIDSYYQTQSETNNMSDGKLTALPFGGKAPYSFKWSNGKTGQTITGLSSGFYSVTITDVNGCSNSVPDMQLLDSLIIPGRIQVENYYAYKNTVSTSPTTDTDGGEDVILPSIYHQITCKATVTQSGWYAVSARLASKDDAALIVNDKQIKTTATGGTNKWVTSDTIHIYLTKGPNDLVIGNANKNLLVNWIELELIGTPLKIEHQVKTKLELFPNPANTYVNLNFDDNGPKPVSIALLSITGVHIKTFSDVKTGEIFTLNLPSMAVGNYCLLILYEDKTREVKKLTVQ